MIRAALVGNDRHDHVFPLTQSLELYDIYQAKMLDYHRKLEVLIATMNNKRANPVGSYPDHASSPSRSIRRLSMSAPR